MQLVLHLDDSSIAALIDADGAERAVWNAFAAWGRGEAATTQRSRATSPGGMASAMAAVVPPYCGGKVYSTAPHPDGGAPRFTFVNVLFDTAGALLATMDGGLLTALRTPAISSLAVHHLARPGSTIAAVIGAGNQGWPHVEMLHRVLPGLTDLRIAARPGSAAAARLTARAVAAGIPARLVDRPGDAVAGAHVVVTVTNATTPLFPADAIGDDTLVCAVGATKYDRVEIPGELVARCSTVVCDDVAGSRVECGDLIAAARTGHFDWADAVELHAVAAGTVTLPRAGDAPVLFESQGVAVADIAVSGYAYDRLVAGSVHNGTPGPHTTIPTFPTIDTTTVDTTTIDTTTIDTTTPTREVTT
ncbi:hypothetical protein [Desertimonas flava]|uniref:hypothetical protein n=1 Tax=Desertimonas flava TaxID=2064846 RepID=UPI0023EFF8A9|nr:hypothetical protein [Desertimonas flava]